MRFEDWSVVIFIFVVKVASFWMRRIGCERVFFVRRGLVWRLVVSIVMRLRIDSVVVCIVVGRIEGVMLLVLFVVAIGVVDVFDRVLDL
jgi:hypothetical protein